MLSAGRAARHLHAASVPDFSDAKTPRVHYEFVHAVRQVYMDSPHPEGPIEWFMGLARQMGRCTLVVDAVYFTDRTWLDGAGNFHSPELHVVERYTLMSQPHQLRVTIEDPVFYQTLEDACCCTSDGPNIRLFEYECIPFGFEHLWLKPSIA